MEICRIDWDLVLRLVQIIVPIGIAIFVYQVWHDQKGKEVVANEVKELLKNILEEITIVSMLRYETQKNMESINEKIERLNILTQVNMRSALFIGECLDEDGLKEIFEKYNTKSTDNYVLLRENALKVKSPKEYLQINNLSETKLNEFKQPTENVLNKISPYAIYRKKFKLNEFK
ncbi:hypothetical protein NQ647_03370 [Acinetobacter baumannii]|nr:hypothetical protein [Acinetobacter baumannii]